MLRRTCILALLLCTALPATAETLRVLTTGAFKPVIVALLPEFERQTASKVEVSNDTAGALVRRVEAGERFDLLVLTPAALAHFAGRGVVAPDSIRLLARVGIGVAVRSGAAQPDIRSVDSLRRALLGAGKVAYIDPASGGSSGLYLDGLFRRLGIAEQMATRSILVPGGLVATRLLDGQADLALHQISEILAVKGVSLVGPLPEPVQHYTDYAAGIASAAAQAELAQAFLERLGSPAGGNLIQSLGMLPVR